MTDGLNAKYWLVRAVKMRSLAERIADLEAKDSLLRVAVAFDRLADETNARTKDQLIRIGSQPNVRRLRD